MKKRNFLIVALLSIVTAIVSLVGLFTQTTNAAATELTVRYETYTLKDYCILTDFKGEFGYDLSVARTELAMYATMESYGAPYSGADYWANNYSSYGTSYVSTLGGDGSNVSVTTGSGPFATTTIIPTQGRNYDDVVADVAKYDSIAPVTDFAPGDQIVIVMYVTSANGFSSVSTTMDLALTTSTQTNKLFDGSTTGYKIINATDAGANVKSLAAGEVFFYPNTTETKMSAQCQRNGTTSQYIFGGFNSETNTSAQIPYTGEIKLYAISFKIDSNASGAYVIDIIKDDSDFIEDFSSTSYDGNSGKWNLGTAASRTFTVTSSSSTATSLTGLTAGTTSIVTSSTVNATDVTTGNVTVDGNTYTTYKINTPVSNSTLQSAISAVVKDHGTVDSVSVSSIPTSSLTGSGAATAEQQAAESALKGGNTVTSTASGYPAPLGNPGSTTFVAVTVKSSGTDTLGNYVYNTYFIEIPKAANTTADLTGLSITGDGTTSTNSYKTDPAISGTSVTPGTYYVNVPTDATYVEITPNWNLSTLQSVTIDGTAYPMYVATSDASPVGSKNYYKYNGSGYTATGSISSFNTYTATTDTAPITGKTYYTASGSTYTVFSGSTFAASTTYYTKDVYYESSFPKKITFSAGAMPNIEIKAIPQDGNAANTKTYKLVLASTNTSATIAATDSTSASVALSGASPNFAGTSAYNATSFTVAVSGTDAKAKVEYYKDSVAAANKVTSPTYTFGVAATATTTKTMIVRVIAQNPDYTKDYSVAVTKPSADNHYGSTITWTAYDKNSNAVDSGSGTIADGSTTWTIPSALNKETVKVKYVITPAANATATAAAGGTAVYTTKYTTTNATHISTDSSNVSTYEKALTPGVAGTDTTTAIASQFQTQAGNVSFTLNFKVTNKSNVYSSAYQVSGTSSTGSTVSASPTSTSGGVYEYRLVATTYAGSNYDLKLTLTDSNAVVYYNTTNTFAPTANGNAAASNGALLMTQAGNTATYSGPIAGFGVANHLYVRVYSEFAIDNTASGYTTYSDYHFNVTRNDTRDTNNNITGMTVSGVTMEGSSTWSFVASSSAQSDLKLAYGATNITFNIQTQTDFSTVYAKKNSSTGVTSSSLNGTGAKTGTGAGSITIVATGIDTGSTVTAGGEQWTATTYYFQCKAENGTDNSTIYSVRVLVKKPSTDKDILTLVVASQSVDTVTPISSNVYAVPVSSSNVSLAYTISANASSDLSYTLGSSSTPSGTTTSLNTTISGISSNSYATVIITVYSQAHTTASPSKNTCTLYLIFADTTATITGIDVVEDGTSTPLKDVSGNPYTPTSGNSGSMTLAYSAATPEIKVNKSVSSTVVTGDGTFTINNTSTTSDANATATIKIQSKFYNIAESRLGAGHAALAAYSSQSYTETIAFTRKHASTVSTTSTAPTVTINGGSKNGTTETLASAVTTIEQLGAPTGLTATVDLPANAKFTLDSGTTYYGVTPSSSNPVSGSITFSGFPTANGSVYLVTLIVKSEAALAGLDPSAVTKYDIKLAPGDAKLNSNSAISSITVVSGTTQYLPSATASTPSTFNAGQPSYSITVPGSVTTVDITVVADASSTGATLEINGSSASLGSSAPNTKPITANSTTTFTVTLYAEDYVAGTATASHYSTYTLNITAQPLDKTKTLSTLGFNGSAIAGFVADDATKNSYTVHVPYTTTTGYLTYTRTNTTKSSAVTNAPSTSPVTLNVGSNALTVTVTAEDPTEVCVYTVNVIRDDDSSISSLVVEDALGADLILTSDQTAFSSTVNNYTGINVPYATTSVKVSALLNAAASTNVTMTITANSSPVQNISNNGYINLEAGKMITIKVIVSPASYAEVATGGPDYSSVYTVEITRSAGSSACEILTYTTEDGNNLAITSGIYNYEYILPRSYASTGSFNPVITVSASATPSIVSVTGLAIGKNTKTITVTSENGATRNYTFDVYCVEREYDLDTISIVDSASGNQVDNGLFTAAQPNTAESHSVTVPFTVDKIVLDVNAVLASDGVNRTAKNAEIYVNGSVYTAGSTVTLTSGVNSITVQIMSEYGKYNSTATNISSPVYTLLINRKAPSEDATIKELQVVIDGVDYMIDPATGLTNFDPSVLPYVIENIGDTATTVLFKFKTTDPNAVVSGYGTKTIDSNGDACYQFNKSIASLVSASSGYVFPFTIDVTPESGNTTNMKSYDITICRGPVNINDNCEIGYISLLTAAGDELIGQSKFVATQKDYNVTIPFGSKSFTLSAIKNAIVPSSVTIIDADGTSYPFSTGYSKQFQITSAMYNKTLTYKMYCTAQSSTATNPKQSITYEINVKFEAANDDTSLKLLKAFSKDVTTNILADDQHTQYDYSTIKVNANSGFAIVQVEANNAKSTVTINSKTVPGNNMLTVTLAYGDNTITVLVTAESGSTATYNIHVYRSYPAPKVTDLQVADEKLLDINDKAVTFNEDVDTYCVKVSYYTSYVTIRATVDNPNYIVITSAADDKTAYTGSTMPLVRLFSNTQELVAGQKQKFVVTVISENATETSYTLYVTRKTADSINTNIATIGLTNVPEFGKEYNNLNTVYPLTSTDPTKTTYNVPNNVSEVNLISGTAPEIIKSADGNGATIEIFNNKDLKIGENKIVIIVTAEDGETSRVIMVTVNRAGMDYSINEKALKDYVVENKDGKYVIQLGRDYINTTLKEANLKKLITAGENVDLTVDVVSNTENKNLNQLILQVSDGTKSELVYFELERNANVAFSVETRSEKTPYDMTTVETNAKYTMSIGTDSPTNITVDDLKKLIINDDDNQELTVTPLTEITDDTSEIVLAVSNGDGVSYVRIALEKTPAQFGSVFNIIIWILLGLAVALLAVILVCVNKDKYGSVSKKRRQN